MSTFSFQEGATTEDTVKMLLEYMTWIMSKLDSKNVRRLFTEECNISSVEGETKIVGPLLLMYDKQDPPVLRRRIGYDPGSSLFVDEWYNPLGVLTAYVDTNGQLKVVNGEFAGDIKTAKDAYVGNNIFIGNMQSSNYKSIQFLNDETEGHQSHIYLDGSGRFGIFTWKDLYITAGAEVSIFTGTFNLFENAGQAYLSFSHPLEIGAGGNLNLSCDVASVNNSPIATEAYVDEAINAHILAYHT